MWECALRLLSHRADIGLPGWPFSFASVALPTKSDKTELGGMPQHPCSVYVTHGDLVELEDGAAPALPSRRRCLRAARLRIVSGD